MNIQTRIFLSEKGHCNNHAKTTGVNWDGPRENGIVANWNTWSLANSKGDFEDRLPDAEVVSNYFAIAKSWNGVTSSPNPERKVDSLQFYR